jgi:hypothetical protein
MKIEAGYAELQRALFENLCAPFENSFGIFLLGQSLAQLVY